MRRIGWLALPLALGLALGLAHAQGAGNATTPGVGPGMGPGMGMGGAMGPHGMGPGGMGYGGMGPGMHGDQMGWALMTPQERREHRAKMMGFTNAEDCRAYVAQHHRLMADRAKQRGMSFPAAPPQDPCAGLKAKAAGG